jgi:hypothetical protein
MVRDQEILLLQMQGDFNHELLPATWTHIEGIPL